MLLSIAKITMLEKELLHQHPFSASRATISFASYQMKNFMPEVFAYTDYLLASCQKNYCLEFDMFTFGGKIIDILTF